VPKKEDVQKAISRAAESGMGAVAGAAFEKDRGGEWAPRPGCLLAGYSSGERVLCGVLLAFYFAIIGTPDNVTRPERWENSIVDAVWPGAYFMLKAVDNLTDSAGWDAIWMLLPKGEGGKI
jgi:hypothetical protein